MIQYSWRSDDRYYAADIKNRYRQLPLLLHLRSQALMIWIFLSSSALLLDFDIQTKWVFLGAFTVFACAFPSFVKCGIILKYRFLPTFVAETTFKMDESEVEITGPGAGRFPWAVYDRAGHFSELCLVLSYQSRSQLAVESS